MLWWGQFAIWPRILMIMKHHEESCPGAQHRQGQTFFKLHALDRALKQGETFLYPVSLLSPVPHVLCKCLSLHRCSQVFTGTSPRALITGQYNRNFQTNEALFRLLINSRATCCHFTMHRLQWISFMRVLLCYRIFSKLESMAKSSPLEVLTSS